MRWKRAIHRSLWWAALALPIALAAAWLAQLWYEASLRVADGTWMSLRAGCLVYEEIPRVQGLPRWLPNPRFDVRRRYEDQWATSPWVLSPSWSWRFEVMNGFYGLGGLTVRVPMWAILAGALAPLVALKVLRVRFRTPGCCGSCGYTRTGLVPDARCPECGTLPTK